MASGRKTIKDIYNSITKMADYYIMARKYGGIPPSSESCEKMKFVTQLSKDEVITRMQ